MDEQLPEVNGVPCIGMSALTGVGAPALMPTVMRLYSVWNQRIPTARLNKWLVEVRNLCRAGVSWFAGSDSVSSSFELLMTGLHQAGQMQVTGLERHELVPPCMCCVQSGHCIDAIISTLLQDDA